MRVLKHTIYIFWFFYNIIIIIIITTTTNNFHSSSLFFSSLQKSLEVRKAGRKGPIVFLNFMQRKEHAIEMPKDCLLSYWMKHPPLESWAVL